MNLFLGIGAQKSGTTWIYSHLSRHPQVCFPGGKEVHFWDLIDSDLADQWLKLLANSPAVNKYGYPIISGEITPSYSLLDSLTISKIASVAPDIKLFICLRNPIERAWSDACMGLSRCKMTLSEASDQWFIDHAHSLQSRRRGDYPSILSNWIQIFPKQQFLVLFFDDIVSRPLWFLQRLASHLDIDKNFSVEHNAISLDTIIIPSLGPDQSSFRSQASQGRSLTERPILLAELHALYDPLIRQLESLVDRSLQSWIDYTASPLTISQHQNYQEVRIGGPGYAMVQKLLAQS